MQCAVVGAGAWGTALADLLAGVGHETRLWALEPDVAASINDRHENQVAFLPELPLCGPAIRATNGPVRARCRAPRSSCSRRRRNAPAKRGSSNECVGVPRAPGAILVVATKGIEQDTLSLMTGVVADPAAFPGTTSSRHLGPQLCRRSRGAPADGDRGRVDGCSCGPSRSVRAQQPHIPRLHTRRRHWRRARGCPQERDGRRDRNRRRGWAGLQLSRGDHYARAG